MSEALYMRAALKAAASAKLHVVIRDDGIFFAYSHAAAERGTGWFCRNWRAGFVTARDIVRPPHDDAR